VMLVNIMEVIEKEDLREKKVPFIDRNLWLEAQERLIDERSHLYPTLDMCLGCDRAEICSQVKVEGLERLYCGIKNKEWRK
ncbi:hypothetical protein LCGC14_3131150, partial [marine sediment metagenome]